MSKQEIDLEKTTNSSVVTKDGRELALSEVCEYYVNGREMYSRCNIQRTFPNISAMRRISTALSGL